MPDELPEGESPENFENPPPFFQQNFGDTPDDSARTLAELTVEAVYAREGGLSNEHFVVLTDNHRRMPIVIDPCTAVAISLALEGKQPDRPLTHDLTKAMLDRLDVRLDRVVIDDIYTNTYYAKVYLQRGDEELSIDARPSDSIALALRFDAPIFVSETILEHASE